MILGFHCLAGILARLSATKVSWLAHSWITWVVECWGASHLARGITLLRDLGDLWSPWSLTTLRSSWDDPPRNLWLLCFLSREIYVALESNWIDTVNSQVISLVGYKSLTQPPGKVLGALTTRWTKILDLGEWNYWNYLLSTSPAPEML